MIKEPQLFNGHSKGIISLLFLCTIIVLSNCNSPIKKETVSIPSKPDTALFVPPDTSTIPHDLFGDMVRYGRELIMNTPKYIGPNGTMGHYLGNKVSCTNCHMDAGTRPFAFNFYSTHARYPQYRGRENMILTLSQRINNCIERPCNGKPLPLDSKEIVAMASYIKWLGSGVPVNGHAKGDDALDLQYPNRAADTKAGAEIYATDCARCHGRNGEGQWNLDSSQYTYPPLWGPYSFQKGSSPSRVLKLAAFIKANMPYDKAAWNKPFLTDEQAIDVAAFVNDDDIHSRPQKTDKAHPDYPNDSTKAIDYDKAPYPDTFSERQHKYGPYEPIIEYHKAHHLPVIL